MCSSGKDSEELPELDPNRLKNRSCIYSVIISTWTQKDVEHDVIPVRATVLHVISILRCDLQIVLLYHTEFSCLSGFWNGSMKDVWWFLWTGENPPGTSKRETRCWENLRKHLEPFLIGNWPVQVPWRLFKSSPEEHRLFSIWVLDLTSCFFFPENVWSGEQVNLNHWNQELRHYWRTVKSAWNHF